MYSRTLVSLFKWCVGFDMT